jgi:RNA polymerase sigma-70 factor, ECF subfamily
MTAQARFRAVFEVNYDFIWRTLLRLGVDQASVDDATQEVFVVFARKLGNVVEGTERSFLFGTARRVAADARRATRRRPNAVSDEILAEQEDAGPSPEDAMRTRQARAILDVTLEAMDDGAREVFVLSDLEGLAKPEVAQLLAIPEGTVASRLRRARDVFTATLERLRKTNRRRAGEGA